MADFSRFPESKNFEDRTNMTRQREAERIQMLNNYLNAKVLNRWSPPNPNYHSGLGEENLRKGTKFPTHVDDDQWTMMDILFNPEYLKDMRFSDWMPEKPRKKK